MMYAQDHLRPLHSPLGFGSIRREGFTLIEVLIAAIVLAIGLIGLAAVFPVVITQQKEATDQSMAISAGSSGEVLLKTRLGNFASTIAQIPDEDAGIWYRINAIDPGTTRERPYLHMPDRPVDLRLSRLETGLRASGRQVGNMVVYDVATKHRPLSTRDGDTLQVRITVVLNNGKQIAYSLRPTTIGETTFSVFPALYANRLNPTPNAIDYINGDLQFNVLLGNGESVRSAEIDYTWLDDRLLSHQDRLFPAENPHYAWEMCIRKGFAGQAQYCLFVYRFDGPAGKTFNPDIPTSEGREDEGMLHQGKFDVFFDTKRRRFFIDDPSPNSDESRSLTAGAYLLPVEGSAPVKVLRFVDGIGWELEAPPTHVGRNGQVEPMIGDHDFWYLPLSVLIEKDQITWRLTPLLAYTKQVDL